MWNRATDTVTMPAPRPQCPRQAGWLLGLLGTNKTIAQKTGLPVLLGWVD